MDWQDVLVWAFVAAAGSYLLRRRYLARVKRGPDVAVKDLTRKRRDRG